MTELADALDHLVPIAEAILALAKNHDELDSVERQVTAAQRQLTDFKAKYNSSVQARQEAVKLAEQARSEVISAQAKAKEIVDAAQVEAKQIVAEAKVGANDAAARIKGFHEASLNKLTSQVADAEKALSSLKDEISARQLDHDQVLASISALQKRLSQQAA